MKVIRCECAGVSTLEIIVILSFPCEWKVVIKGCSVNSHQQESSGTLRGA